MDESPELFFYCKGILFPVPSHLTLNLWGPLNKGARNQLPSPVSIYIRLLLLENEGLRKSLQEKQKHNIVLNVLTAQM